MLSITIFLLRYIQDVAIELILKFRKYKTISHAPNPNVILIVL